MRVRALGQAGFVLEGKGISLAVDPYLSSAIEQNGTALGKRLVRRFPPPIQPLDLAGMTAVLITHAHDDHCDPATLVPLAASAPEVQFILPSPAIAVLRSCGIPEERMRRTRVRQSIQLGSNCTITSIPAAHYAFDPDSDGEPAYVGYVISMDGIVCYHAGDTILYDGLADVLRKMRVDIAMLPINGRDAARDAMGITGNLEPKEAFTLARDIGASLVIPMHNDLFQINRRDAHTACEAWEALSPGVAVAWLPPGAQISLNSLRRD